MDKLRMVIVELYFEERWKWWILVEVARRFILILILVIFPRSTVSCVWMSFCVALLSVEIIILLR